MTAHNPSHTRTSTVRARPSVPRELEIYRAQRELGAIAWNFQRERGLTGTELLLIIGALQALLTRHVLLNEPHPANL